MSAAANHRSATLIIIQWILNENILQWANGNSGRIVEVVVLAVGAGHTQLSRSAEFCGTMPSNIAAHSHYSWRNTESIYGIAWVSVDNVINCHPLNWFIVSTDFAQSNQRWSFTKRITEHHTIHSSQTHCVMQFGCQTLNGVTTAIHRWVTPSCQRVRSAWNEWTRVSTVY